MQIQRSIIAALATLLVLLPTTLAGCKKAQPPAEKPKPTLIDPDKELEAKLTKLPGLVDKDLYRFFNKVVLRCKVDVASSSVSCDSDYFSNVVMLYLRRRMPRDIAMSTIGYVFETGDDRLKTVAAEFASQAMRTSGGGYFPKPPIIKRLIGHLATLPTPQAVDVAPSIALIAVRAKMNADLFEALEQVPDQRVAAAAYKYVMAEGRMDVFDEIYEKAGSKNLDVAVSAVEAARVMGIRTVEENKKLCDWMKELRTDGRPMIESRAASFLATCGTSYLEIVLGEDETRWANKKAFAAGLAIYIDVCRPGVKHYYGAPSKAQCARLKKLVTEVVNNPNSPEGERVVALGLLADQFPGKDTLALASRFAESKQPAELSRKAQAAVLDLGGGPRKESTE